MIGFIEAFVVAFIGGHDWQGQEILASKALVTVPQPGFYGSFLLLQLSGWVQVSTAESSSRPKVAPGWAFFHSSVAEIKSISFSNLSPP